jgi:hypothetical protein
MPPRDDDDLRYLRSARAIRERCQHVYDATVRGDLEHWVLAEERLLEVTERVIQTTRATYGDVRSIPYHSRWRHFDAGGVDRVRALEDRLRSLGPDERLAASFDLVVTSVLLDAGAGDRWTYRDGRGLSYARSEGLAVASHDLFVSGAFSGDPSRDPLRADGEALERTTAAVLANGFQVDDGNPLVGLEGRAAILQRLGQVTRAKPEYFGTSPSGEPRAPRVGHLAMHLVRRANGRPLHAADVLTVLLDALDPIWPGREVVAGTNLGDVWTHSRVGRVPFHKLSQWLAYSLCESLERAGTQVVGLDELTGLAEYRNGGLFVDGGVLAPRNPEALREEHDVSSDLVIEWRALTVVLLDRVAQTVRAGLGASADELPLAKVLEGGTWRAGRILAREKRAGGGPPLRIRSDGTVF